MPHIDRYAVVLEQFAVWEKAFTPDECDQIVFLENLQNFEKGSLGIEGSVDKSYRNSEVIWIREDQNSAWLFQKFSPIMKGSCMILMGMMPFNIQNMKLPRNNIMIGMWILIVSISIATEKLVQR